MNPFQKQLAIFRDKNSTEVQKTIAKLKLDDMERQRLEWNKKNNPKKYCKDMAEKADNKEKFWLQKSIEKGNEILNKAKKEKRNSLTDEEHKSIVLLDELRTKAKKDKDYYDYLASKQ